MRPALGVTATVAARFRGRTGCARALVETAGFEGQGLGRVLMRRAMLSAHKRRLSVVPGCAPAEAFLERNPQYRTLVPTAY